MIVPLIVTHVGPLEIVLVIGRARLSVRLRFMILEVPPAIVRLAGAVTNEGPINLRSVF